MTAEGWREVVDNARHDDVLRQLLVALLVEQDNAKARLQERFACTGRPWRHLVDDILEACPDA